MAVSSAEPHLAAIPETVPTNDLPGSARASPRSTSDSPARGTAQISPTSRLLRPTLSWQAKASWIPDLPTASGTTATGTESDVGSSQGQEPIAAVHARDQATMAASQLSPSPPSAAWQSVQDPLQTFQGAAGQSSSNLCINQYTHRLDVHCCLCKLQVHISMLVHQSLSVHMCCRQCQEHDNFHGPGTTAITWSGRSSRFFPSVCHAVTLWWLAYTTPALPERSILRLLSLNACKVKQNSPYCPHYGQNKWLALQPMRHALALAVQPCSQAVVHYPEVILTCHSLLTGCTGKGRPAVYPPSG